MLWPTNIKQEYQAHLCRLGPDFPPIHRSPGPNVAIVRNSSCIAPGLQIDGEITGKDDLQIDGHVEGTIQIPGQRLTVGRSGQLICNVEARDVVIYGKVVGNLRATGLVEIKKDGSVIGEIRAGRISIEDGAYFKGSVDMEGLYAAAPSDFEDACLPSRWTDQLNVRSASARGRAPEAKDRRPQLPHGTK